MSYQKLLRQMIGVTLVMLLLVGCGAPAATPVSEAPAATSTPELPAATPTLEAPTLTPTPVPPTATPTPSITGFGQAEEFGPWRIRVINTDQASSIDIDIGSYEAVEGRTLYLVELELENTADAASTLKVDPQQIEVVDSEGETYMSIGGAPVGSTYVLHIYQSGGSRSMTINPASGGPAVTLKAAATDEKTKEWTIELSGKGSAKLTMAFNIPSGAQVKELRWPELRPFSLEQ